MNTDEFMSTPFASIFFRDFDCYHPQADYELFKSLSGDEEGKCLEYIEWTLGKIYLASKLHCIFKECYKLIMN